MCVCPDRHHLRQFLPPYAGSCATCQRLWGSRIGTERLDWSFPAGLLIQAAVGSGGFFDEAFGVGLGGCGQGCRAGCMNHIGLAKMNLVGGLMWSPFLGLLRHSEVAQNLLRRNRRDGADGIVPLAAGFAKKGKHLVGVARQYCGRLGKTDNSRRM